MNKIDNLVVFPKTKRAVPGNRIPNAVHYYHGPVRRNVEFLPWNLVLNILIFLVGCLRTIVADATAFFQAVGFLGVPSGCWASIDCLHYCFRERHTR